MGSSALDAEFAMARGEMALAGGHPEAALPDLRRSVDVWRHLWAPYETARICVLIAHSCRALGDEEGARPELESARESFAKVGARRDLHAVEALLGSSSLRHGLSARELQVLRLVAAGRTNRSIASELFLIERTVHRA